MGGWNFEYFRELYLGPQHASKAYFWDGNADIDENEESDSEVKDDILWNK